jgi:hypothetical protein
MLARSRSTGLPWLRYRRAIPYRVNVVIKHVLAKLPICPEQIDLAACSRKFLMHESTACVVKRCVDSLDLECYQLALGQGAQAPLNGQANGTCKEHS